MSQKDQQSSRKGRHESTTSISALILSIVCCVGLVHVELKIHHHEQLLNAERVPTIPGEEQRVRTKPTAQGTFNADNNPTVGIQGNILGECLVTARTFVFRFLANFSLGIVFRLMWLIHHSFRETSQQELGVSFAAFLLGPGLRPWNHLSMCTVVVSTTIVVEFL